MQANVENGSVPASSKGGSAAEGVRDGAGFRPMSSSLWKTCGPASRIEATGLPEYAFAGRSNAGKSSLINLLLNRKSLARTSSVPGKTRTINYYLVNGSFYFVDLPGYGYAKMSEKERLSVGRMVERYLDTTVTLRTVFLLLDTRIGPTKDDIAMYEWALFHGYQPVIIAAKCDKLKKRGREKALAGIRTALGLPPDGLLIPVSVYTKEGIDRIYELLT